MAMIKGLEAHTKHTFKIHPSTADCRYGVFTTEGSKRVLQIDTYGSKSRKLEGKQSQTLQFDELAARQLWTILSREFGFR